MLPVDVLEFTGGRRKILSRGTRDTIDQSRRARLHGRAELFRELRHKSVHPRRVDKEAYVQGICEGVEHHLWSSDSRSAYRGIFALCTSSPCGFQYRMETRYDAQVRGKQFKVGGLVCVSNMSL